MSVTRIYYSGNLTDGQTISLSPAASHHVARVLRMAVNDNLMVFNGLGFEYRAKITALDKKIVHVYVGQKSPVQRESPLNVHLAQGISRGERMDYVVQKAVELGVRRITPIFSARCNVKLDASRAQRRVQHWRSVMIAAAEQSGRLILPALNTPLPIESFCREPYSGLKYVCTPTSATAFSREHNPQNVTLLIGPEGGLTDEEVQMAQKHGYQPLRLGPRILRTETAAVVAITAMQVAWGDLG